MGPAWYQLGAEQMSLSLNILDIEFRRKVLPYSVSLSISLKVAQDEKKSFWHTIEAACLRPRFTRPWPHHLPSAPGGESGGAGGGASDGADDSSKRNRNSYFMRYNLSTPSNSSHS